MFAGKLIMKLMYQII